MIKKVLAGMLLIVLTSTSLVPPHITSHAQSYDIYIVQPGDSLWKISRSYQIGLSEIINANKQIQNPDLIYPNDEVKIPLKTEVKAIEQEVVELTNQYRQQNGLSTLQIDWQLARVARYKSADMRDQNYFAHQSPTYGSPFQMMRDFDVSYQRGAENIAAGQQTAQGVVDGWMNSQGHRENTLNPNMTHIGVGYATGGSYSTYWTQMFIQK